MQYPAKVNTLYILTQDYEICNSIKGEYENALDKNFLS